MINFVIYEKRVDLHKIYELIIFNLLGSRREKFKIFEFEDLDNINYGKNIYILGSYDQKELIALSKNIRINDWNSQIILISNFNTKNKDILNNKLLILDYIDDNEFSSEELKESLLTAYKILSQNRTLNFTSGSEIYRIPYFDILFIEKGNNQNHCVLNTKNGKIIIKDTINNLEEILDPAIFLKIHRSCIINIYSVIHYDFNKNILYFINNKTDMISRDKRQILKLKLLENTIVE